MRILIAEDHPSHRLALRIIRAKRSGYLPLMALTAYAWDRARCLAAGMDDFLAKPYDIHDLHRKIQSLTVQASVIEQRGNGLRFGKEKPMNAERLRELRALDERELTKLLIPNAGAELVVHKNAPNKIAHDFRIKKQKYSEFADRTQDKPRLCRLYWQRLTIKCLRIIT